MTPNRFVVQWISTIATGVLMLRRRTRPLTILDGMMLVGMTAGGLALGRTIVGDPIILPKSPTWDSRPITYFLLALSLGFLALRLKSPRPPIRRLMCQPGIVACCAVTVITLIDATRWGIYFLTSLPQARMAILERYWRGNCHHPAVAVVAAWLGLLISHRWRSEPSWIDRFGRLIGFCWLLALFSDWRFSRWTTCLMGWIGKA